MSLLLLIRHAPTDAGRGGRLTGRTPGIHLSDDGRRRARDLAARLAGLPVAALYASPMERCRETAAPLATAWGLRVRVARDLGEVDYGEWTGRQLSELARTRLWRAVQHTPSRARFPGGESLLEVQERGVRTVEHILAEHPRSLVAAVSHGDVIRLLLAHYAGLHTDLFQRLTVDPASVSALVAGDGTPRIIRVNDPGDISDLAPARERRPARKLRG